MSKQQTSGASAVAALLIIAVVGWVLSQIWMYLVIGGAVAVVGWIVWVIARTRANSNSPHLVAAETPRSAPAPDEQFRALVPVDATVFEDPVLAEAAALKTYAAWTRQLPMAPANPSELVRSLELRVRHIGRLTSEVAARKVVWRQSPYGGPAPVSAATISAEAVDPWAMSSESLRERSHYIASCDACASSGQVECSTCRGTTKVTCSACQGEGKAYGYASNGSRRLMNCKTCHGKRELKCTSCTKGKATCPTCQGSGRNERWLEIEETVRHDVQIEPDGDMTRAFRWGADGTVASREEIEADAKIVCELHSPSGILHNEVVHSVSADWLVANWHRLQPKLNPGERARNQTFWLLEVPSIELSYSLGSASPTVIGFEGRRMLAPPSSIDNQFAARAQKVRLARYVVAGLALTVPLAYVLRGSYYWNGWVAALAGCTIGLAFALDGFLRESTLGRRAARTWAIGAGAAALLACTFAVVAEPSARAARRYAAAGELDRARAELTALGNPNKPSHAEAWADLYLADAMHATDAAAIAEDVTRIPEDLPQHAKASQHLFETASRAVEQQLANKRPAAADNLLAQIAPALPAREPRVGELRARVYDEQYVGCATSACRWKASRSASQAAASATRTQRLAEARANIVDALQARPRPDDSVLARLRKLDEIINTADIIGDAAGDTDLAALAHSAGAWAAGERARIPLVGAERAVAAALLHLSGDTEGSTLTTTDSNVAINCSMRSGRCVGVYLVANEKAARVLNDSRHAAATKRTLSQAVGHQVELPDPPTATSSGPPTMSKRREGGITIAARWRGSDLVELRIGDATP